MAKLSDDKRSTGAERAIEQDSGLSGASVTATPELADLRKGASPNLERYESAVRTQWLGSGAFEPEEVAKIESYMREGKIEIVEISAESLRRLDSQGALVFKEHTIDRQSLASITLPLDPDRVRRKEGEGPIIMVDDGPRLLLVNGNHRIYKLLHENPKDHPVYAVRFKDVETFEDAVLEGSTMSRSGYSDPRIGDSPGRHRAA